MIIPIILAALTAIATIWAVVVQENDKIKAEKEALEQKEKSERFESDLRQANLDLKKANEDLQKKIG